MITWRLYSRYISNLISEFLFAAVIPNMASSPYRIFASVRTFEHPCFPNRLLIVEKISRKPLAVHFRSRSSTLDRHVVYLYRKQRPYVESWGGQRTEMLAELPYGDIITTRTRQSMPTFSARWNPIMQESSLSMITLHNAPFGPHASP